MVVRSEVGRVGIPLPRVVSSDAVVVMWVERGDLLSSPRRGKQSFGTQCHHEGVFCLGFLLSCPFPGPLAKESCLSLRFFCLLVGYLTSS